MKAFRKIRISLFTLLAIAMSGLLASGQVRPDATDSKQPDAATVARAREAFIKYMSSHRPMVRSTKPAPSFASEGVSSVLSFNWSGFADVEADKNGKTVSSVSGEWVMPAVQCPSFPYKYQDVFLANWVGIDGATNGTVEQLGSGAQCYEGVLYYYVWYEMFPAGTVIEGTQACINNNVNCPQPGDFITASVTVTPSGGTNKYKLSLTDFTRPQESFSVTKSCDPATCLDASAEWIVERPAFGLPFGFQILPLADYTQTGFYDGTLTSGGKTTYIEHFQDGSVVDMDMLDDSETYLLDCVGQKGAGPKLLPIDSPNSCPTITPAHGSFNVTWDSSF